MRRLVLDRPWALLLGAVLVALVVLVVKGRSQPHSVRAAFASAVSIAPGLDVQVDGVDVGKVTKVAYEDGQAIVDLGIKDDAVWPLRQGTTAAIRFGTTIGNGTRSVSLTPGPENAPALPDGGIIASSRTTSPVEFDELFNTLSASTRRSLRGMFEGGAAALEGRGRAINDGLRHAPAGLQSTGDVLGDLLADEAALTGLIRNGDKVTTTLAARRPVISDLVSVAATTFAAFGRRTEQVRASLDRFAPTLADTRSTLARSDSSLDGVDELMQTVAPGVRELPGLARTAAPALSRLQAVSPVAVRTLATARDVSPDLRSLLDTATPFMEPGGRALKTLAPMLGCIRPYAPELAGFFATWGSFTKNLDTTAHYARIHLREGITALNGLSPDAATVTKVPGTTTRYAFPRPPGLNAGKPFYQPECGITPDALDPAKDPERP